MLRRIQDKSNRQSPAFFHVTVSLFFISMCFLIGACGGPLNEEAPVSTQKGAQSEKIVFSFFPHVSDNYDFDPPLVHPELAECVMIHESYNRLVKGSIGFLCSNKELGMVWSEDGLIKDMACQKWDEPSDEEAQKWENNYLCFPEKVDQSLTPKWSTSGPIRSMSCVNIKNYTHSDDGEAFGWDNNYFCYNDSSASLE